MIAANCSDDTQPVVIFCWYIGLGGWLRDSLVLLWKLLGHFQLIGVCMRVSERRFLLWFVSRAHALGELQCKGLHHKFVQSVIIELYLVLRLLNWAEPI